MRFLAVTIYKHKTHWILIFVSHTVPPAPRSSPPLTHVYETPPRDHVHHHHPHRTSRPGALRSHAPLLPPPGDIFVIEALDYEASHEYYLTVEATDGGSPPLRDRKSVV